MDRPTGLPMVLILESRSHLDLGDLPNLLAAELGVMTVRLERAIRSLDGVARVHVNRWGDGSAHLHMWFLARPYGRLQLRGTFLSLWDDILPPDPRGAVAGEPGARRGVAGASSAARPLAEPPRIEWQAPSSLTPQQKPPSRGTGRGRRCRRHRHASSVALAEAPDEAQSRKRRRPRRPPPTTTADESTTDPSEEAADANGKPEPKAQGDDGQAQGQRVAAGRPAHHRSAAGRARPRQTCRRQARTGTPSRRDRETPTRPTG